MFVFSTILAPRRSSVRTSSAMHTGAATINAMKIVRFDHSISPMDRSKMRRAEAR